MPIVEIVLLVLAGYLAIGALVAVAFVARGHRGFGPAARDGSIGFRLAVAPGVAGLWPVVLAARGRARREAVPPRPLDRLRGVALIAWIVLLPIAFALVLLGVAARFDAPAPSDANGGDGFVEGAES